MMRLVVWGRDLPRRREAGLIALKSHGGGRPPALKSVRQAMIEAGLARTTINQRVVRPFKWAVENGPVPPAVYQGLAAVRGLQRGRS